MKKILFLSLIVFIFNSVIADAVPIKFSIDPASPVIDGNITPDDIIIPIPSVYTSGSTLGLANDFFNGLYDNVNALSYGQDHIKDPFHFSINIDTIFFSIDRTAVGLLGTDVYEYAKPGVEEAHGDVYKTQPPFGNNSLSIDEGALGLTPGFWGDDIDALELDSKPNPSTNLTYFSVDSLSVNKSHSNDILMSAGGGSFGVFAEGVNDLGLSPGDDLDALVLWDVVNPGVLDHGLDKALFSLSTFSLSAYTISGNSYTPGIKNYLSPADILYTDFPLVPYPNGQKFMLLASASDIGLRPDDEVDAIDTIPEPSTILLLLCGLIGLVFY